MKTEDGGAHCRITAPPSQMALNWVFVINLNFIIPLSSQLDEEPFIFQTEPFDLTEFIVWNIKGLQYRIEKIKIRKQDFVERTQFLYKNNLPTFLTFELSFCTWNLAVKDLRLCPKILNPSILATLDPTKFLSLSLKYLRSMTLVCKEYGLANQILWQRQRLKLFLNGNVTFFLTKFSFKNHST